MQPITLAKVDSCHSSPSPSVVPLIISLDSLPPEIASLLWAVLAEADVDEEVTVVKVRLKVRRRCLGGPFFDRTRAGCDAVPAAKFPGALRFKVHGCAKGDDALDLHKPVSNVTLRQYLIQAAGRIRLGRQTFSGAKRAILAVIHPP